MATTTPRIIFVEGAAPGTPGAGLVYVYAKADGLMYSKDDAGVETSLGGGTAVDDATIATTDITTNNASTSKHGWLKKLSNVSTEYMSGTGVWSTPAGGSALASATAVTATDQSLTGNNSFVDLATAGPAVTVTVNTKVKVTVGAETYFSASGAYGAMGFALSSGNTVAAARASSFIASSGAGGGGSVIIGGCRSFMLTGLTPGSTVFTAKYNQLGGAGTTDWQNRNIIVECLD